MFAIKRRTLLNLGTTMRSSNNKLSLTQTMMKNVLRDEELTLVFRADAMMQIENSLMKALMCSGETRRLLCLEEIIVVVAKITKGDQQ